MEMEMEMEAMEVALAVLAAALDQGRWHNQCRLYMV